MAALSCSSIAPSHIWCYAVEQALQVEGVSQHRLVEPLFNSLVSIVCSIPSHCVLMMAVIFC